MNDALGGVNLKNNSAAENPSQERNSNVITVDFTDVERLTRRQAHERTLRGIANRKLEKQHGIRTTTIVDKSGIISDKFEYANGTPTYDMPHSVLDGRLGEVCQKRMLSIYPVAYAWPALVTVAGALVQPGPKGFLRTNLYTCLVGDKATGKSSSIDLAIYLLDAKSAGVVHDMKAGSAEG
jgi:hypothetical protein